MMVSGSASGSEGNRGTDEKVSATAATDQLPGSALQRGFARQNPDAAVARRQRNEQVIPISPPEDELQVPFLHEQLTETTPPTGSLPTETTHNTESDPHYESQESKGDTRTGFPGETEPLTPIHCLAGRSLDHHPGAAATDFSPITLAGTHAPNLPMHTEYSYTLPPSPSSSSQQRNLQPQHLSAHIHSRTQAPQQQQQQQQQQQEMNQQQPKSKQVNSDSAYVLIQNRTNNFTAKTWWVVDLAYDPPLEQGATPVVARCLSVYPHWDELFTRKVLKAYRQYLALVQQVADWTSTTLVPPPLIDKMWKIHAEDINSYCHDCMQLCGHVVGRNVQHLTISHKNMNSTQKQLQKQQQEFTIRQLQAQFGHNYDEDIWAYDDNDSDNDNHGNQQLTYDNHPSQQEVDVHNNELESNNKPDYSQHLLTPHPEEEDHDDGCFPDITEEDDTTNNESTSISVSVCYQGDRSTRVFFKLHPKTRMSTLFDNVPYCKFGINRHGGLQFFLDGRPDEDGPLQASETAKSLHLKNGDQITLVDISQQMETDFEDEEEKLADVAKAGNNQEEEQAQEQEEESSDDEEQLSNLQEQESADELEEDDKASIEQRPHLDDQQDPGAAGIEAEDKKDNGEDGEKEEARKNMSEDVDQVEDRKDDSKLAKDDIQPPKRRRRKELERLQMQIPMLSSKRSAPSSGRRALRDHSKTEKDFRYEPESPVQASKTSKKRKIALESPSDHKKDGSSKLTSPMQSVKKQSEGENVDKPVFEKRVLRDKSKIEKSFRYVP